MMTLAAPSVAILFARCDSNYKADPRCDVFDIERDARTYAGRLPVVAHPPCRAWGRLRAFARPRPDEKDLARWAVAQVRRCGGVLEHPAGSKLWVDQQLPAPGQRDAWGGWTMPITQHWFGHKAEKKTWLYVVGIEPSQVPPFPLVLGEAEKVIAQNRTRRDGTRKRAGDADWRPEVTKAEREHTPPLLAAWLVDLALACASNLNDRLAFTIV